MEHHQTAPHASRAPARTALALKQILNRLRDRLIGEASKAARRFHELDYARVAIRHRHAPLPGRTSR